MSERKINLEEIIKLYSLNDTITTRQSFIYFGKQLLELAAENAKIKEECNYNEVHQENTFITVVDKQSIYNIINQVE